jgi:predicted regulator of Ras-like GTPase activity (Roadblock/LC7/MglB family)
MIMKIERIRWPHFWENQPTPRLKNVLADLNQGSDIEGAVLVDRNDAMIVCGLPEERNYEAETPEILTLLGNLISSTPDRGHNSMFAQCILDYNGGKILAQKLKDDLILLVVLKKQGYISLAMLDIENSIRKIEGIL